MHSKGLDDAIECLWYFILLTLSAYSPSNEWQDTVADRLKAFSRARSGSTGEKPKLQIFPPGSSVVHPQDDMMMPMSATAVPAPPGTDERDRQRRRVDATPVTPASAYPSLGHRQSFSQLHASTARSPERGTHMQRHSAGSAIDISGIVAPGALHSPLVPTNAARFSPPVAPQPANASSASPEAAGEGPESATPEEDNEEGITDAVGQLSLNEESQVRFHGKASGLHLLAQSPRADGRNRGGIWHFPRARVWPPVAPPPESGSADEGGWAQGSSGASASTIGTDAGAGAGKVGWVSAKDVEAAARAKLPARDVQEQLLDLYFTHVHPYLPVVHKEQFWEDFRAM